MRKLTSRAVPFQLPGYPDYLASLLYARGITDQEQAEAFLHPSLDQLHDPYLMQGISEAVAILKKAREDRQVVVVYGDYDADGVCASAIVLNALEQFGIRAFSYIPARLSEGYGINADAVTALSKQAGVLISVDCGITAVEEVSLARDLGMQVILTDHHTLPDGLPHADALVHPALGDYPYPTLCGAGVAWKLACALIGLVKAQESLELAALATVADLVPLTGENRVIVSLGLRLLSQSARPGMQALMRVAGIKPGEPVSSEQVAFQLAPRLNAGGRLSTAQDALNLLMAEDVEEANRLAQALDALNRERREVEQQVLKAASAQVHQLDLSRLRSIVVRGEDWNPGVVGLTAGKLAQRWNYPCIVLTNNGEEVSGSGRSVNGIDLHEALKACQHLLSRFGGHRMAAGLSLPKEKLAEFAECFDAAVKRQLGEDDLIPETVYDTALALTEVTLETVDRLDQLAPFGLNNPAPVFLIPDLKVISARPVGADGAHLKLTLAAQGAVREGIAFGQGKAGSTLGKQASIVSSVDRNAFNGRVSVQLKIAALLPGEAVFLEDQLAQARAVCVALDHEKTFNNQSPQVQLITALPDQVPTRGTLLAAYTPQMANLLHQRYPQLQVHIGAATDPRAFSAIVYAPDWRRHFAPFERILFADGLLDVYTAQLSGEVCKARHVEAMPMTDDLKALLAELSLSLDRLRDIYLQLKNGQIANFTGHLGRDLAALNVLRQLGLVQLDENDYFKSLLPMVRIEPMESALYRHLQS